MHIKRFLEKMAVMESKQNKDLVMPISDARGLRDDITTLLSDYYKITKDKADTTPDIVQVEIKGGSFK
jgi:hypothetical protein